MFSHWIRWVVAQGVARYPVELERISFSPNSEIGLGSARVPRASSGVAPALSSLTIFEILSEEKFVDRRFRRDAENHTPEACAPRNATSPRYSIPEFGLK